MNRAAVAEWRCKGFLLPHMWVRILPYVPNMMSAKQHFIFQYIQARYRPEKYAYSRSNNWDVDMARHMAEQRNKEQYEYLKRQAEEAWEKQK